MFCRLVRMSVAVLLTLSVVRAFAGEPAVGSEEARPAGAGLRPPLKRYVQFSRIPLSRRRPRVMRTDGRNQTDKVDQAQLAVERGV